MKFERGSIIHTEYGDYKYLLMVDNYTGESEGLTYLFRCLPNGKKDPFRPTPGDSLYVGTGQKRIDRPATQKEKKLLLSSLSRDIDLYMKLYEACYKKPSPLFEILLNHVLK